MHGSVKEEIIQYLIIFFLVLISASKIPDFYGLSKTCTLPNDEWTSITYNYLLRASLGRLNVCYFTTFIQHLQCKKYILHYEFLNYSLNKGAILFLLKGSAKILLKWESEKFLLVINTVTVIKASIIPSIKPSVWPLALSVSLWYLW